MTSSPLVRPLVVEVDGIPMSALLAEAPHPRAVILALHGGASSSRYFDCPDEPELSLLRIGATLGFTMLALDRPGYGQSARFAAEISAPATRVDLAYAAVEQILQSRPQGAGVFLLAHSIGCELALRIAADERGKDLLGLELAGTGLHHHAATQEIMDARPWNGTRPGRAKGMRSILWHPAHLYPADVVGGASIGSPGPAYEGTVVDTWAGRDFPALAAHVRVPVHFSLGDHEMVWQSGPAALADIAARFTASPRVVVHEQVDAGHNLSLGLSARAYHLKALSFAEECVVARGQAALRKVM